MTKKVKYDSSAKKANVKLRWSKAYAKDNKGDITPADGYEIQYANNKFYSGAKTVTKAADTTNAEVSIKKLNTKKKYRKNISKYRFRIRSYADLDGQRIYSKWNTAATVKKVKVYSFVKMTSRTVDKNNVNLTWEKTENALGYKVFRKKARSVKWSKIATLADPNATFYYDSDLLYSTEYGYKVLAYGEKEVRNPSKQKTSYLQLLSDSRGYNRITTPKAERYTIEFDGNENTSGTMEPMTIEKGSYVNLDKNKFKRNGYKFVGWSLKRNNKVYMNKFQLGKVKYKNKAEILDLAEPGKTVKLYACWKGDGPESAVDWAIRIADNDDFVYGTQGKGHCYYCQGGKKDYVCNPFVAAAYTHGMPHFKGMTSGSTIPSWWEKHGFRKVGKNVPAKDIKKGDIVCCYRKKSFTHIMLAAGDDIGVHASEKKITKEESIGYECLSKRLKKVYSSYVILRLKD